MITVGRIMTARSREAVRIPFPPPASSRWSRTEGREISRKYYSITPKGRGELSELMELWRSFEKNVSGILEEKR